MPAFRDQLEPIADLEISPQMTVRDLVDGMYKGGGFTAKKLAIGAEIMRKMIADEDCRIVLSFPAAICATGVRGVIRKLIREGAVDAIITTCGTLDHDLARTWRDYYQGSFRMDDRMLHREGVNRLGNVLVPNECYGEILEERLRPWIEDMAKEQKRWSTAAFCRALGERLADEPNHEDSLLYWAAERDVPVFVPGITDGSVGSQIWLHYQRDREFTVDVLADEQALSDFVFDADRLGALMIGGGISKHHTIWWSQFREGLDYAVYLTTAPEWDGSLSGARLEEAISWGKVKEEARIVNVEGEATVLLPLLVAAALD